MTRNYSSTAATTTLSAPINDTQTSMIVAATTGFPAAPFALTVDTGGVSQEAVLVTSVAGTTLTITRGYDSTSAQAHLAGAVVTHSHLAIDFRDAATHQSATTGVHGVTGAVVGTTDTQTLTNKTLGSTNTLNGFTASKIAVTDGTGKLVAGTSAVPTGTVVGTTDTQTLTNKTVSADDNTLSGIAASSFVLSNASGNIDGAAAQKAIPAGVVVGTTDTQTLTNKTLTSPTVTGLTLDGVSVVGTKILTHTADGNRLDAAVAATSNPAGIRLIAGQQSVSFSAAVGTLTFPGGGFAGGVLAFSATTLSGTGGAVVVNGGSVSKTTVSLFISGFTGTAVVTYFALGF